MNGRAKEKDKYNTNHIDTDILNFDINTREELLQIIEEENLKDPIQWENWDKVVNKTKQQINQYLQEQQEKKKQPPITKYIKAKTTEKKTTYVYQLDSLQLIGVYTSQVKAAKALGMPQTQVGYCIKVHKGISMKWGYFFTNLPINETKN